MISPSLPSPVGQKDCNKFEAYNPKVIHSLSTACLFPVDNLGDFIHNFDDLSTISVDNLQDLWIKIFDGSYFDYSHDCIAI